MSGDSAPDLAEAARAALLNGRWDEARDLAEQAEQRYGQMDAAAALPRAHNRSNLAAALAHFGEFERAAALARESLPVLEKKYGPEHPSVAETIHVLGSSLVRSGSPAAAEPFLRRSLTLARAHAPPIPVATGLYALADALYSMSRTAEAESLLQEAMDQLANVARPHPVFISVQHFRAHLMMDSGRWEDACQVYREATEEAEALNLTGGPQHAQLLRAFSALAKRASAEIIEHSAKATRSYDTGDWAAAVPEWRRCAELIEKVEGARGPRLVSALQHAGGANMQLGRFDEALADLERASAIARELPEKDWELWESALYGWSSALISAKQWRRAREVMDEVMAVAARRGTVTRPMRQTLHDCNLALIARAQADYVGLGEAQARRREQLRPVLAEDAAVDYGHLMTIGRVCNDAGEYALAEVAFRRALALERRVPRGHLAETIHILAGVLRARGAFSACEQLALEGVQFLGPGKPEHRAQVASLLNLAGQMAYERGDVLTAIQQILDALQLRLQVNPRNPGEIAESLNAMAGFGGGTVAGRPLLQRALDFVLQALGPQHQLAAVAYNNLANVVSAAGDLDEAEALFAQAIAVAETAYGPFHPRLAIMLRNRAAFLLLEHNDKDRSLVDLARSLEIEERHLRSMIAIGSEADRVQAALSLNLGMDVAIAFAARDPGWAAMVRLACQTAMNRKGCVLDAMANIWALLGASATPEQLAALERLNLIRAQLAAAEAPGSDGSFARLAEEQDQLERDLAIQWLPFAATMTVSLEQIAQAAPIGTALVEFVQYRPPAPGGPKQPHYGAFVVVGDRDPAWIDFGPADELDEIVDGFRNACRSPTDGTVYELGQRLFDRLLSPILTTAEGVDHFVIAPEGAIGFIPFDTLSPDGDSVIDDALQFSYVVSVREIMGFGRPVMSEQPPVIICDPDYDAGVAGTAVAHGPLRPRFERLKGTAVEGRAIKQLMPEGILLTASSATKRSLQSVRNPRFLHLATHGFFSTGEPQPDKHSPRRLVDAMARSGLALAGANAGATPAGFEGVVTALELGTLRLRETDLVVLSACETGLGEAQASEGLLGLRRALGLAGARAQLVTLWKIPDSVAPILLKAFYGETVQGGASFLDALKHAKQTVRMAGFDHPFFWASFILLGDTDRKIIMH